MEPSLYSGSAIFFGEGCFIRLQSYLRHPWMKLYNINRISIFRIKQPPPKKEISFPLSTILLAPNPSIDMVLPVLLSKRTKDTRLILSGAFIFSNIWGWFKWNYSQLAILRLHDYGILSDKLEVFLKLILKVESMKFNKQKILQIEISLKDKFWILFSSNEHHN